MVGDSEYTFIRNTDVLQRCATTLAHDATQVSSNGFSTVLHTAATQLRIEILIFQCK